MVMLKTLSRAKTQSQQADIFNRQYSNWREPESLSSSWNLCWYLFWPSKFYWDVRLFMNTAKKSKTIWKMGLYGESLNLSLGLGSLLVLFVSSSISLSVVLYHTNSCLQAPTWQRLSRASRPFPTASAAFRVTILTRVFWASEILRRWLVLPVPCWRINKDWRRNGERRRREKSRCPTVFRRWWSRQIS